MHEKKAKSCDMCDKIFALINNLKDHSSSADNVSENNFACQQCDYQTRRPKNIQNVDTFFGLEMNYCQCGDWEGGLTMQGLIQIILSSILIILSTIYKPNLGQIYTHCQASCTPSGSLVIVPPIQSSCSIWSAVQYSCRYPLYRPPLQHTTFDHVLSLAHYVLVAQNWQ